MERPLRVVIVGGTAHEQGSVPEGIDVRRFASSRYAGNGSVRRAAAAIDGGSADVVVLLVRWIGHSGSDQVRAAARRSGVPCVIIPGGVSSLDRLLRLLLVEV
jgi:hypothetical protein